ncbi:MAG: FecR family protein [Chitinophagaceae bacterium]|nr:FecR family protein [Chitinophagaceae bacterium]
MSQEKFWILFSKKLAGEAGAEELNELEALILQHPEWQYAIQNIEELWKNHPHTDSIHAEDAYLLHLHRMEDLNIPFGQFPTLSIETKRPVRKMKWYWAAAILLLVAGSWWGIRKMTASKTEAPIARAVNEITTRPGSKSKVELPDGTMVWLNAGSKLTYDKNYGLELREVTLTGEGYFDVVKNKNKPFIIHTSSINIKVLGTVFNVKAYPQDKHTETSLIRGSIEVTIKNRPNDKIILSPSEKLVVENDEIIEKDKQAAHHEGAAQPTDLSALVSVNKLKYISADSVVAETAWINNRLIFRDEAFSDLALRMERWYDVQMEIGDPALQNKRVTGIFQGETIEQALEALKEMIPAMRYEHAGSKIIIHR